MLNVPVWVRQPKADKKLLIKGADVDDAISIANGDINDDEGDYHDDDDGSKADDDNENDDDDCYCYDDDLISR